MPVQSLSQLPAPAAPAVPPPPPLAPPAPPPMLEHPDSRPAPGATIIAITITITIKSVPRIDVCISALRRSLVVAAMVDSLARATPECLIR